MKKNLLCFTFLIFQVFILSCTSPSLPKESKNDELSSEVSQLEDELSESGEFDDSSSDPSENTAEAKEDSGSNESEDDFADFEDEDTNEKNQENVADSEPEDDFFDEKEDEASQKQATNEPLQKEEEPIVEESLEPLEETTSEVLAEEDPLTSEERQFSQNAFAGPPVEISDISYLANESGGTVLIKVDSDFYFKSRSNIESKQYIIEIANANLPAKFKRPYLMKDFKGAAFGAINSYQKPGSSIARIVIQMKEAKDPIIRKEGNTLLIIPATTNQPIVTQLAVDEPTQKLKEAEGLKENLALESESSEDMDMNIDYSKGGTPEAYPKYEMADETKNLLLNARTLEEFLLKHRMYYGKPISIQVEDTGIKDVLEMIAEEAGLNLALPEQLGGKITLKLRKVPWDQAFILILKQNGLGYIREGNVIRIDALQKLEEEINYAHQIIENRYNSEPLQIKILPVSYLKLEDAVTKLTSLKTERGSVISDVQTNSVIVTDVEDSILKMEKLLGAIDVSPKQVLIEGKVIEAIESFSQGVGINWTASGSPKNLSETGGVGGSPIAINPTLSISPVQSNFGGIASLGINVGVLDVIGTLNAKIALLEDNNMAKVISSPRIITLSGEGAKFSQTIAVPFVSSETSTSGAQGVTTTQTTSTQNFTLSFDVTPVITSDDSVRLELNVSRTNPASGAILNGQVTTSSSSATTKVLVGNNQTAVIGGIYSGSETSSVNKVPVLGDIPILGWLFKSKAKENSKNELMIFVTPRILSSNKLSTKSPVAKKLNDDTTLDEKVDSDSKSL
ncbi:MAG: type IV pilus secretin PilQ [Bdellovibrionaceae bacterium]|nr:type IV pilus secretin PilQ [Pseudobdellovibrionaceae bacterium]